MSQCLVIFYQLSSESVLDLDHEIDGNVTTVSARHADITTIPVDAVVNAANSSLLGGGGVDGAIHEAGGPKILRECQEIAGRSGPLPAGKAVGTSAGNLLARHVIHTVGPIWDEHDAAECDELLASCYRESLNVAAELGDRTISFPSISTGVYQFPVARAVSIAVTTTHEWLRAHPEMIDELVFVCFDHDTLALYEAALAQAAESEVEDAPSAVLKSRRFRRGRG